MRCLLHKNRIGHLFFGGSVALLLHEPRMAVKFGFTRLVGHNDLHREWSKDGIHACMGTEASI